MGKRTNTAKWDEKTNRWKINVQKDGKRKSFYSSTPGRTGQREANAKADAWLDEGINDTTVKVTDIYNEYIAELKTRTSRSHWANEESRGRIWIVPYIGHKKVGDLTEQNLQDIINAAHSKGNLSMKSLQNLRATLVAFIKYCRKRKVTTFRPEDITIPQSAPRGKRSILEPVDIIKLFSTDATLFRGKEISEEYINLFRLQVLTGLRPGEAIGLKWSDISDQSIKINRSINIYGEITNGKNQNAIRTFAITPTVKTVLEAQKALSETDFVFDISIKEQGLLKRWYNYLDYNKIPRITLYELRHTFVSVIQTLPQGWIKTVVGHSESMDTFGIYSHELTGQKIEIAGAIEQIFADILNGGETQEK